MNPEDIPDEYDGESTETVQLSIPEWANSLLTEYSESFYGNNQHKGEFAARALILMDKIQKGDGVAPEVLPQMGDVSGKRGGSEKRRFSTDEQYLNNLELGDPDELSLGEYDYVELCSDTYSKRIPIIAAVSRRKDANYTTGGLRVLASEIFPDKHRKTINRYVSELEDAIVEGDVKAIDKSVAHLYLQHECENGDFGTKEGQSLKNTLLTEYEEETLEETFYEIDECIVTGGLDGFKAHVISFANEMVEELGNLESEIQESVLNGKEIRRAVILFTMLIELPELVERHVAERNYSDVDVALEQIDAKIEEGVNIINNIRSLEEVELH